MNDEFQDILDQISGPSADEYVTFDVQAIPPSASEAMKVLDVLKQYSSTIDRLKVISRKDKPPFWIMQH